MENLGLTIKFRGDTVEFTNDIAGINNALKLLKADAKALNKELKLDPTNTDLMSESLNNLKEQQKALTVAVEQYKKEIDGMHINNAEDEKNLLSLRKGLADCETMLRKVNEQIDLFNVKDISTFGYQLKNISKELGVVQNTLNSIAQAFTLVSTASAAALTVGVKYNAEMEQYTIALTTALGSQEKALEAIEKIKQDATKTPWGVSELVEYNRTLIATGLSAEESEDIILSLGDAVSAVGGTSDVFSRMVQNLQQIKNAGNATAMDIRQFANAGIDIYGILSDYLGKTTDQISEQDRTWENIIGALQKASSEGGKYFGAMESQSESLNSQLNKLKDEWEQALGDITEALLPTLKELVSIVKGWATALKELNPEQKEMLGKILAITAAIAPLFKGLSMLTGGIKNITNSLGTLFTDKSFLKTIVSIKKYISGNGGILSSITSLAKSGLGSVLKTITAPLSAIKNLISGIAQIFSQYGISGVIVQLGTVIGQLVTKLISSINPITAIISALVLAYTQSESFRTAINSLISMIGGMLTPILTTLGSVFTSIWSILSETLIPTFLSLFKTLGDLLAPLIQWYSDYLSSTFTPIIQSLVSLIGNVLVLAFTALIAIINGAINVVKSILDYIKMLYDKFKESEAFEFISSEFNSVIDIIKNMINWVKQLIDWVSNAINWLTNLFSFSGKSVDVNVNSSNGGGGGNTRSSRSGGFSDSYMSGGYNFTINVTNQGGSLTANNIKGWARMLTDQINENLGKEM